MLENFWSKDYLVKLTQFDLILDKDKSFVIYGNYIFYILKNTNIPDSILKIYGDIVIVGI